MRHSPYEGRFKIKNREKYLGDPLKITYRSLLEYNLFCFMDSNKYVLKWGSEIIAIPYNKPMPDGSIKPSLYRPDVYVEYIDKEQKIRKVLLEIKPEKFINKSRSKKAKTVVAENYIYMINMLKAEAAKNWCAVRGIEYRFAIEKNILR